MNSIKFLGIYLCLSLKLYSAQAPQTAIQISPLVQQLKILEAQRNKASELTIKNRVLCYTATATTNVHGLTITASHNNIQLGTTESDIMPQDELITMHTLHVTKNARKTSIGSLLFSCMTEIADTLGYQIHWNANAFDIDTNDPSPSETLLAFYTKRGATAQSARGYDQPMVYFPQKPLPSTQEHKEPVKEK